MRRAETVVVGGGLVGLSSALALARQGGRVLVLDAGGSRRPASLAGAGLLAPLSHKQVPGPVGPASVAARGLWGEWLERLADDSGVAVEYDTSGALVAAATAEEVEILREVRAMAEALGEPCEHLETRELRRLAPDLRDDLAEGLLLPAESRVDNVACLAAVETAVRRLGVEIACDVTVHEIARSTGGLTLVTSEGEIGADRGVLAAGCWTSLIEGAAPLPVRPVRGQMIRVGGADWPWQGMIRVGNYYAVRRGPSDVLFGATVEEVGYSDHTTARGAALLSTAFSAAFPGLADRLWVDFWSGLRPACTDGSPIIGTWRDWPLFVASGHHRDGILFAPWTADLVAAWSTSGGSWQGIPEFSPDRFSTDGAAPTAAI